MKYDNGTVGANVANLRGSRMTQTALADLMRQRGFRWTQPTVVAIEKGERPLRLIEAAEIAAMFNARIEELFAFATDVRLRAAREELAELDEARGLLAMEIAWIERNQDQQ